jgi:hypothetical protein
MPIEGSDRDIGLTYTEQTSGNMAQGILQMQMNMQETIEFIEHALRGEYLKTFRNAQGEVEQVWEPAGDPVMNEKGIRGMSLFLNFNLNPNTYLSNTREDQINKMMTDFHIDLASVIMDKQVEWGIAPVYMDVLTTMLTNIVWQAMLRSLDHLTLKSVSQSQRVQEQIVRAPPKPKWKFW